MKKKRFAVKFFSVMMVLCLMVGVSAAWDCCMPMLERYEPPVGNSSALCVPHDWVQGLPYNGCRFGGGVAAGIAVAGLHNHPRWAVPVVAGVSEVTRIFCKPVEAWRIYWSHKACTPAPNNDVASSEI
ncbi:hypothetical protein [Candidatus Endomicrobiellum devescovinae]|jgi:hypothetical protein|uniref:hypothetical protein n=1 Tax=Candidatus Endomicrobiellum devescovinae TaxID=3242322 RepID=UPI0028375F57|nr:hypothetical protein [Endomicrobium sp.]